MEEQFLCSFYLLEDSFFFNFVNLRFYFPSILQQSSGYLQYILVSPKNLEIKSIYEVYMFLLHKSFNPKERKRRK